jgi:hypothetical protein
MLMLGVEEDVECFGTRTGVTCKVVVPVIERCPKDMVCKCTSVLMTVHRLAEAISAGQFLKLLI